MCRGLPEEPPPKGVSPSVLLDYHLAGKGLSCLSSPLDLQGPDMGCGVKTGPQQGGVQIAPSLQQSLE